MDSPGPKLETSLSREVKSRELSMWQKYLCTPHTFVFVDKTGSDRRDAMRKFSYSLRGKRCVAKRLLARRDRVSAIGALTVDGILNHQFIRGTVNGETFRKFY